MRVNFSSLCVVMSSAILGISIGSYGFSQDVSTQKAAPAAAANQTTIGARLGVVNVNSLDNGLMTYGAYGDRTIDNRVVVGGSLDYWKMSTGGVSNTAVSINDVALGGNAKFIFTGVRSAFKPFATAGLSAHRISISQSEKEDSSTALGRYREKNNDVSTQLGMDIGAGAVYTFQPQMDVNGQVLYRQLASAGSNFNQLGVSAGLGYRM